MSSTRLGEFLRFAAVGAGSAIAGMAAIAFMTEVVGLHYLASYVSCFVAVNALAYLASRRFAFRGARLPAAQGLLRYYAVTAASLALNSTLMYLLVSVAGCWYLGVALALTVANAPLNYLLHRRLSFGIGTVRGH